MNNRQWLLARRPHGLIGPEDFRWVEGPAPVCSGTGALVRTLWLSCDPTQRNWVNPGENYVEPVAIGEPMRAIGVGEVIESGRPELAPGDRVVGMLSWSDYQALDAAQAASLQKVDPALPPLFYLTVTGVTGFTAYFGLLDVGGLKAGDAVLVSGAAGATGSAAVQIARLMGASKVVGVAGGPQKCAYVTGELGADACIDYKSEDVAAQVKAHFPAGVDVFFDNTGGPILDAALANLAQGARVVICGGIATGYESWAAAEGPKNYLYLILKSARMQGFLVTSYAHRFGEAAAKLAGWAAAGQLKTAAHVVEGLERAPEALRGLFTGANIGKTVVKVADPMS